MFKKFGFLATIGFVYAASTQAALNPALHHKAQGNKTGQYISDGYFTGGDRSVTALKLKDIRRGKSNEGYERIVLDLAGDGGEGLAPYYQVQMAPSERRIVLSIWADAGYEFDAKRIQKAFAKSAHVKRLNIVPRVEDGLTIIEFVLNAAPAKGGEKVEVFHLAKPARIIMDVM